MHATARRFPSSAGVHHAERTPDDVPAQPCGRWLRRREQPHPVIGEVERTQHPGVTLYEPPSGGTLSGLVLHQLKHMFYSYSPS